MAKQTQDYANHFDPEWFIENYIDNSPDKIIEKSRELLMFCLDKFHDIFSKGDIKGRRLLDVGSGPTIHSVISASDHVMDIYLSDYNAENRKILLNWYTGKRDLDLFPFRHVLNKQNRPMTIPEKQTEIRTRVQAILPIDVTKHEPFGDVKTVTEFDIITCKLCIESASHSIEEYRQSVKNVVSMLKPDGHIVLAGVLEQTQFPIGKYMFRTQFVTKGDVLNALSDAGVQILKFEEQSEVNQHGDDDFKGMFVLVARKL